MYQLADGPYLTWDGLSFADAGEVPLERWAQDTIYELHADAIYQTDNEGERRDLLKHAALVRSQPGIAVQPEHLDADPWLLNVLNGTIDLRPPAQPQNLKIPRK